MCPNIEIYNYGLPHKSINVICGWPLSSLDNPLRSSWAAGLPMCSNIEVYAQKGLCLMTVCPKGTCLLTGCLKGNFKQYAL